MHRMRSGQIDLDLADGATLRIGERVGQRLIETRDEGTADSVSDAALFAFERALAHD